ncbi:MAG: polyprenyl synthetase family protein [Candidatus Gastranaerophilales bacterium]|nr:polyprenyl synthetase family protein [Candidatus Gastranaerophilales bacterium]
MKVQQQKNFNLQKYLEDNKKLINSRLEKFLKIRYPSTIWESMRYTALLDGKRIRPVLCLESARACGGDIEIVLPTACAIEMIHAQSLIHDDLPCMDNDDLRRGKPTNHMVFGESIAVLAGDGLLSYAPQVVIQHTPNNVDRSILLQVVEELVTVAGPLGLVGGQSVDIESENKEIDLATFNYIHTHKTGKLFAFALRSGALLSNAPVEHLNILTEYAQLIGYAFQIADDILDVIGTKESLGKTPGKDKLAKKNTHPSLYGMKESINEVERLCSQAQQALVKEKLESPALIAIAGSIVQKVKK